MGNSITNSLLAYPIFLFGYSLKSRVNNLNEKFQIRSYWSWSLFIFSIGILIIVPAYNDWPKMYINGYGKNILLFTIGVLTGLYIVYFIARLIGTRLSKIISILSRGNILTLGLHSYFVAALHGAGLLNGYVDYVYAFLIMILMIPIIIAVKKYIPWIIGIKPIRKNNLIPL